MNPRRALLRWLLASLLFAGVAFASAFDAGGTVYTKNFKTTLLAEPSPLAAPAGEAEFAHKFTVKEVKGKWLRVSDGSAKGWIFLGNLTDTKPTIVKGLDGVPLTASKTTATAAARPLTETANEYSKRHNLVNARGDLDWLNEQCHGVTDADVEKFLQEKKKGEFQ